MRVKARTIVRFCPPVAPPGHQSRLASATGLPLGCWIRAFLSAIARPWTPVALACLGAVGLGPLPLPVAPMAGS